MDKFLNIEIGKVIKVKKSIVSVCKTHIDFTCAKCIFKKKGDHCPQGKKHPLCFSSERKDKESVYYPTRNSYYVRDYTKDNS